MKSEDPKQVWSVEKSLGGNQTKVTGKMLIYKDSVYTLDRAKANMFSIEYVTVTWWKSDKWSKKAMQELQRDTLQLQGSHSLSLDATNCHHQTST